MKKRIFSIISIILIIFTVSACVTLGVNAASAENTDDGTSAVFFDNVDFGCDTETKSETVLLVNMDTGITVYSKAADVKRYPASLTKIMTYIIVAENVEDFSEKIKVKQNIIDMLNGTGSSFSGVLDNVGRSLTVDELLNCLMISSGNDAALVLADYVGGKDSVEGFVKMMNDKAKALGCENTHFVNPHGLHHVNHYTTARDIYKITSYALTLPGFAEITNARNYELNGTYYASTNHILDPYSEYYYQYAKGIKTGTTDEAGRCLVTSAVADGYSYLAVLMKSPYNEEQGIDEYYNMEDAAELFRWAFNNIELKGIVSRETPVCEEKVNLCWDKNSIQLCPEEDFNALVPIDISDSEIVIKANVPQSVQAPVNEGDYVGTADVYYKDEKVATFKLVADESVERSTLLYIIDILKNVFTSVYFIGAAIIVVILFVIYLFVIVKHNKQKPKRKQVKHYRHM
ncbi:MAG: D-alanyl-D-alanine carboxypeptidase [Oscillospiraceae bacterium]|nr:D-alanyl-D-alanine carboxypeptidase [Oscillospiraceae bacterium]